MLIDLKGLLEKARQERVAVAAFNVPNLEMLRAAVEAAEEMNVPVILQQAEGHDSLITLDEIGPIMIKYAISSKVPIAVHLDHGKTLPTIVKAIKLGFTSVMIDASDEEFTKNVALTKEVVKIAHSVGVSVEAELGHVFTSSLGGGEGRTPDDDTLESCENVYTDPQLAKRFVAETGVDCLAVAFGTIHGVYLKKPKLDLDLIKDIYTEVQVPLVMHGGSGLSESDYWTAIENGIAKINYYTYANKAGAEAIRKLAHNDSDEKMFLEDYILAVSKALKDDYLNALNCFNRVEK